MNRGIKEIRALAAQVVALQAKVRALGLFANDRELLECPKCGLQEDVAFSGLLITSCPDSIGEDTGLRFAELSRDCFRCPACGATVREPVSTAPILNKKAGKRPNVAPASSGSRRRI
jgi:uncharacterized C2H2 Zn-finger protein